jgi:hypothetical protein
MTPTAPNRLGEPHQQPESILCCSIMGRHCETVNIDCNGQADIADADQIPLRTDRHKSPVSGSSDLTTDQPPDVVDNSADSCTEGLKPRSVAVRADIEERPTSSAGVLA